jgi:hypothetical protein
MMARQIFLRRIVGVVFMRVNSKCAHPGAPTTGPNTWERGRWANPWRQGRTDPKTRQLLHRLQALY